MYDYKVLTHRIVDGDTYDLTVDLGFHLTARIRVRLLGGDTPEVFGKASPEERLAGRAASACALSFFEEHTHVYVNTQKTGKYGRWLGSVRGRDPNFNAVNLLDYLREAGHLKEG
jgi:micrococcal nuclease